MKNLLFFSILSLTLFSCVKPTICDCNKAMVEALDGNSTQYEMISENCTKQFGHMNLNEFDEAVKRECK